MSQDIYNPCCDGFTCTSETAEIRLLPVNATFSLMLCHDCYRFEAITRLEHEPELPPWESLEIVQETD